MRANSVEGILMVAAYSVSGMPSLQSCKILQRYGLCGACTHLRMSPKQQILLPNCRSAGTTDLKCARALTEAHSEQQLCGTCAETHGHGCRNAVGRALE